MDGEDKKIGSKRRSKRVETGLDSDDDEPIGSLFKLKKARNLKKVNVGLDGGGDRGKKVVEEQEVDIKGDLRGMDDTLASFRKRLKGPKRAVGSGITKGKHSASNLPMGCSDISLSGTFEDILGKRSSSSVIDVVKVRMMDNGSVLTTDITVENGRQREAITQIQGLNSKGVEGHVPHCHLESPEAGCTLKNQEGLTFSPVNNVKHFSCDNTEDSLLELCRKSLPGSTRKTLSSSSLKRNSCNQLLDGGFSPCPEDSLEINEAVGASNTRSFPVSDFELRNQQSAEKCLPYGSGLCLLSAVSEAMNERLEDSASQKEDKHEFCVPNVQNCVPIHVQKGDGKQFYFASGQKAPLQYKPAIENGLNHCGTDDSRSVVCGVDVTNDSLTGIKGQEEEFDFSLGFDNEVKVLDHVLGSSGLENAVIQDNEKPVPIRTANGVEKYEFTSQHPDCLLETIVYQSELVPSNQKSKSDFPENHRSDYAMKEENGGAPLTLKNEDITGSHHGDSLSMPDITNKNTQVSAVQRAVRKAKKYRHGDMAYEGDADWEVLINQETCLEKQSSLDGYHTHKMKEKPASSLSADEVAEKDDDAAVSVGLKAHAASPVEKIKFKEILKRKGGLQEYLECRNKILRLWNKDITRILPVAECGVDESSREDETCHASLIRDVYTFLDQCGYINFGIATQKGKERIDATHNYKLVEQKKIGERSDASVAETEDGVSFIVGHAKRLDIAMDINNDVIKDGGNQPQEVFEAMEHDRKVTIELENMNEIEENHAGYHEEKLDYGKQLPSIVNVDLSSGSSCIAVHKTAVTTSAQRSESVHFQSTSDCHMIENLQCNSKAQKNVIVIGAGPAGLTAARHLQRQGFSVTVLEGRSRIGGRVFTDRSSLSVPVDLGASIITGVEADVATERRPDPSSLICAQLGLELTVLNSDCPLHDIMTGEKVPADLDEALEAEYNSLLDDMVLLVAQKGEHAERMSLEEGLEYALQKRRKMACSSRTVDEIELNNLTDRLPNPKREHFEVEILSPLERRVMDWHFANLEYGCAALLREVSLPYWNQDDLYGGFGGAHCMIKGGYSTVVESLSEGLAIHLNNVVTDVSYGTKETGALGGQNWKIKICTSNGNEFLGDAVLITVPLGCLKAESIKFSPPLPEWKSSAIQRLGFGVLDKVVLEFPEVFWDDSVDYFGATAEGTDRRGHCFMFWNVRKTVGAPVLIALVVGKAAINEENLTSCDHVNHALMVLRKLFGEASVPDPVASVVTDWGRDPFTYGAYSYVAVGASGDDYDILGRPVENCLFFAGEATCKEHPDTVGGAMMSGLREAVRMIDLLHNEKDYTAEVEAMEAAQRELDSERDEVRDIMKRLDAIELSNTLYKKSVDGDQILILKDIFFNANTNAGRLCLAKMLLTLPVEALKSFAGTKEGLTILNLWILDSMGKDGTQLLRHCVRILVLVSTDLLAVRVSGIGKTVKEKVCVHTSRDIRAIASQLVSVWLEVFRKEKAANGRLPRQASALDSSRRKSLRESSSSKPPLHAHHIVLEHNKGGLLDPLSGGSDSSSIPDMRKPNGKKVGQQNAHESKQDTDSSRYTEDDSHCLLSEEQAAIAAAEAARAKALAAAEAYALEARRVSSLQLPRIPSFHKFARREQYPQNDECDSRRRWSGGVLGRQDCISEIDSRNCRVREWSVDFSAACVNLDRSRMSIDNLSQRSHSNEIASHLSFREHSGESAAADNSFFTKAWIDTSEGVGIKDYHAIERWQSQAAAADCDFSQSNLPIKDEEDSNASSRLPTWKYDKVANESSVSQVTVNREAIKSHPRGADRIKQAVVDYVASLLMPLYKARKLDKDGYKGIMKKSVTKVMEKATDAEKAMAVHEFLDFKRKNKIRPFVDKLIERHMAMKPDVRS